MEICARVYRPRRARESPLFRLVEQHLEEFLRVYPAAEQARSGIVASIATSGDLMQWHPAEAVMTLFRERLLARLIERHAISEDLARRLLSWRHPGFSAHVGAAIPFEDKKAIEDVACYLVRAPLSLKKLVYLDGQKAVLYRSKMNPFLGRNFEAMDLLEWLARLADHIPDAGKHRTHFYAYYANRVRGQRSPEDSAGPTDETEAPKKRRCTSSWARLISKVYQADPLVCQKCGGPLKIVAYVTDELSITRILDHLGAEPAPTGQATSNRRTRPGAGRRREERDRGVLRRRGRADTLAPAGVACLRHQTHELQSRVTTCLARTGRVGGRLRAEPRLRVPAPTPMKPVTARTLQKERPMGYGYVARRVIERYPDRAGLRRPRLRHRRLAGEVRGLRNPRRERAINYRDEDFVAVVKERTGGRGADVILDMVGGDYIPRNVDCLALEGRLILIALQRGARAELNFATLLSRRLTITGSSLRPRTVEQKGAIARALRENVWPLLESGQVRPVVHARFPLAEAASAHRLMESSAHIGKIILIN